MVLDVGATFFVLEVAGVGYKVIAPPSILSSVHVGKEAFVYIHDHIREDLHDLYGFLAADDQVLFQRLLNVDGVGPKVAMAVLSIGPADIVRKAIMSGDLEGMTSVPGVGKKTAQKIILELKGQLVESAEASGEDAEVIQALQALGYPLAHARDAVKMLAVTTKGTSDRVREALKILGKK